MAVVKNSYIKNKCLIFFVKYPEKGKVKTRLAKETSFQFATDIYKQFVETILFNLKKVSSDIIIFFTPASKSIEMKKWLGDQYTYIEQYGENLGSRMANSFETIFKKGYKQAIIIGSDTIDIYSSFIDEAFTILNSYDMIIGPSLDGGYYLIGFNKDSFNKNIFENIPWSTERVLSETLKLIQFYNIKFKLLETKNDIDTYSDLKLLYSNNSNSNIINSAFSFKKMKTQKKG